MKLKLDINEQSIHKFGILMGNQLGKVVDKVLIEDDTIQYHFRFRTDGGNWHFELDKNPYESLWYTLHCSTQQLHLPINDIKDLKIFCLQIARIKQMQSDYVSAKSK